LFPLSIEPAYTSIEKILNKIVKKSNFQQKIFSNKKESLFFNFGTQDRFLQDLAASVNFVLLLGKYGFSTNRNPTPTHANLTVDIGDKKKKIFDSR
jgi:hypothetical protein